MQTPTIKAMINLRRHTNGVAKTAKKILLWHKQNAKLASSAKVIAEAYNYTHCTNVNLTKHTPPNDSDEHMFNTLPVLMTELCSPTEDTVSYHFVDFFGITVRDGETSGPRYICLKQHGNSSCGSGCTFSSRSSNCSFLQPSTNSSSGAAQWRKGCRCEPQDTFPSETLGTSACLDRSPRKPSRRQSGTI